MGQARRGRVGIAEGQPGRACHHGGDRLDLAWSGVARRPFTGLL